MVRRRRAVISGIKASKISPAAGVAFRRVPAEDADADASGDVVRAELPLGMEHGYQPHDVDRDMADRLEPVRSPGARQH